MVLVFHCSHPAHCHFVYFILIVFFLLLSVQVFEIIYHAFVNCSKEEPIDVVYTWVNGTDPKFLNDLYLYVNNRYDWQFDSSAQRYEDKNELRFSLRSLEMFAPWVNHVFIVTNGQIPFWLNLDYHKVTVVTHEEIFDDQFNLPSFSSPAIELQLHRIPGLSKRFIYFNDDIFLQSPIYPDDFYSTSRGFLIYLAWLIPNCALDCSWLYVADGNCDNSCNNRQCQMDGGDCDHSQRSILRGDILEDYDNEKEASYQRILSILRNTSFSPQFNTRNLQQFQNNSTKDVIAKHNRNVILFDKLKKYQRRKNLEPDVMFSRKRTKDVDAYALSLQHTHRILNNFYGFSVRKVPAHAPIMIDKEIMNEMQKKFKKYVDITARNRFRSRDDLQFAFIYYYYIIHEKNERSIRDIFKQFDLDLSGTWSEGELRTVLVKLYDFPLKDEALDHFTNTLNNCSSNFIISNQFISEAFIKNCPLLFKMLTEKFSKKRKYKFDLIKDSEEKFVHFKMLQSLTPEVGLMLDYIRRHTRKFVCLNDNLNVLSTTTNQKIKRLLLDFYLSLFPTQSKYELPDYYRNRFLYIQEYRDMLKYQRKSFGVVCFLLMLFFIVIFFRFLKRTVCRFINILFCWDL